MKLKYIVIIMGIIPALVSAQESDATEKIAEQGLKIIRVADEIRGPQNKDFSYTFQVVETIDKQVKSTAEIITYVKNEAEQWKSLIRVKDSSRATNEGQIILQIDTSMWFYKPGTRNAIRISPSQRLLGGASYADIAGTNYADYYTTTRIEEATLNEETPVYILYLKKKKDGVAYEYAQYYIARDGYRPLRSEFFSLSKRKVKTLYYRKYKNMLGKMRPSEWVIVDGLQKTAVTYIRVQNMEYKSLSDSYYLSEQLKNVPAL